MSKGYSRQNDDSDFKRKSEADNDGGEHDQVVLNEKAKEYIHSCMNEKEKIQKDLPIAARLIDEEIEKVQSTGRIPTRDRKYVDIYREKPVRVAQKVLVPVKEHPKFNFVGKLLGPKGNSLKRLQEETLCKMIVLGRNSMKDRAKEEELRSSKDPKYAHLNEDLHVEISTVAPPAEAHARIAYAMAELRKYLIPDSNDVIRQEQLRELMDEQAQADNGRPVAPYKRTLISGPKPTFGSPPGPPASTRAVLAPKQKVFSILDRARTAMDESYSHAPPPSSRAPPYEPPEYEAPEYRREYYPHSPSYAPVKPSASSSSARAPWKGSSTGANPYSSRRADDHLHAGSSAKHMQSAREARYRSAPYPKAK